MNIKHTLILTLLYLACFSTNIWATEIAVIVHPSNNNVLDERQVRQIFLGQIKTYPDGSEAQTFDNLGSKTLRSAFISQVLRRNESTMNAYWARMIFTAKATPPQELPDSKTVKKVVSSNPRAIAYIEASQVDGSVKTVLTVAAP